MSSNDSYNPKKAKPIIFDDEVSQTPKQEQEVDTQQLLKAFQDTQRELAELKSANNRLNQEREQEKTDKQVKAVNDIVRGFPETFKEHYEFPFKDGKTIAFDVELRPANAIEVIAIGSRATEIVGGMIVELDNYTQTLANAIATFETVAIDVPKRLVDMDKMYRTDIVLKVYTDYQEWLFRFLENQEQ